jgi:hypothetical protein
VRGNCFRCVAFESHRCRNQWIGDRPCPDGLQYEEYTGSTVKQCLRATVEIFQDGYIHCPIIDEIGCEQCMERFGDGSKFYYDESQNYERKPSWRKESSMKGCGLPKGYEDQCCLNRSGMCTLDTADFYDIDRAVGMRGCGFIGVNDRYLVWKYGVPYKDFNCGHCQYFDGEIYGVCTNEHVKPHTKGITENGEKVYVDSKEYYSGAHACKQFKKRGSEEVAKKKSVQDELNALTAGLAHSFAHWEDIRAHGCNDPFWPDGTNMNLIRNHIISFQKEIYELATKNGLGIPLIYHQEPPPEVDQNYMAVGHLEDPYNKPNREVRDENVPKKNYWTKCGRQFQKNSTAVVTGYEIDENDVQCANCPFQVEVIEGWGDNKKHVRWECRAGSKEPNYKNDWTGSLEDKNSIHIHSLHNDFLESIIKYCEGQADVSAAYNADSQADCRRTLAISCSSNKKGIAAKKVLIEKFFPVAEAVPDDKFEKDICGDCSKFISDAHTTDCGNCVYENELMAADHEACAEFEQAVYPECNTDNCPFNDREGRCCFTDEDTESEGYNNDVNKAVDEYGCKDFEVLQAYNWTGVKICETEKSPMNSGSDSCVSGTTDNTATSNAGSTTATTAADLKEKQEEVEEVEVLSKECSYKGQKRDCGMFYPKTGMCSLLTNTGSDLERQLDNFRAHADCEIYKAALDKRSASEKSEATQSAALEAPVSSTVQPFDYSTVDTETAGFLQEKAKKITQMRMTFMLSVAKELTEVHDKLANHYKGTFGAWCMSIGISRDTGENYVRAYRYVAENFGNIEDAEKIQPSLLFAASKPSAPKELSDKVASGDITTHKHYKELEEQLKVEAKEKQKWMERANIANNGWDKAKKLANDTENKWFQEHQERVKWFQEYQERVKAEKERDNTIKAYQKDLKDLQQQLDQAKRNGDPVKIRELGEKISGYQQEINNYQQEIGRLNQQLQEKNRQLKEKPIEVAAAKVVEKVVIPDEVRTIIYNKVVALYEGLLNLTETEMQIFAEDVHPDCYDDVANGIDEAINTLNNIHRMMYDSQSAQQEAAPTSDFDPDCNCGICEYANMDSVTEEELNNNKTRCTQRDEVLDFECRCEKFKDMRSGR